MYASVSHLRVLSMCMLRLIKSKSGKIGQELRLALRWWIEVLELEINECRKWRGSQLPPVHLFCDARSTPPRIAAVLFKCVVHMRFTSSLPLRGDRDEKVLFCDMEPPSSLMDTFLSRGDKQIMTLEVLSIALGLFGLIVRVVWGSELLGPGVSSFAADLQGRDIVIWSDNTAAEAATRRGSTRQFDQNCLVHALWKRFVQLNVGVWVMRVPTKDNIADDPSREDYELLWRIGAARVEAMLEDVFLQAQTWQALSLCGSVGTSHAEVA